MPSSLTVPARLSSLDGLRGVAALIVLAHHVSLLMPGMAAVYLGGPPPVAGSVTWWLNHSPLKLLTAGPEAVIVFFVLSGFVLTLPLLNGRRFDWMAYYPRRIVRIGMPVICSIVFASALALLVAQHPEHARTSWVAATSVFPVTIDRFLANVDPMTGDYALNNPLWSIYWEVAFSMMLALFAGIALLLRRWWPLILVFAVVAGYLGTAMGGGALHYFPAFFVGALAAVGLPAVQSVSARISAWRAGWLVWLLGLAASLLLLIASWLVPSPSDLERAALYGVRPLAALGILVCCLGFRPLVSLLSRQPFQWAGKISFSLYLVHVPIIITVSYLLPGVSFPIVAGVAIVLALTAAPLFHWLVEQRSHGLSRWFGGLVASRFERAYPTGGSSADAASTDDWAQRATLSSESRAT